MYCLTLPAWVQLPPVGCARGDERGGGGAKVRDRFEPAQAMCVSAATSGCACAAAPCSPPRSHTQVTMCALASSAGPVRPGRCSMSSLVVPEYSEALYYHRVLGPRPSPPSRRRYSGSATHPPTAVAAEAVERSPEEGLRVGSGCWEGAEPAGARPSGRARGACGSARRGEAAQGGARPRIATRNEWHPRGWEGVWGHVGGAGMAMCVALRSNPLGVP